MRKNHLLTPWFDCGVKPARSGYYDTRATWANGDVMPEIRLYWHAERSQWTSSPRSGNHYGFRQQREWRGLAEESK